MELTEKSDDELLSAWLDGEMTSDEADRLAERLANEPVLARRLDAMRAGDEAVRRVFATLDETPMPEAVLQRLQAAGDAPENVVPFPARGARRFLQLPVALAATVALAVGLVIGRGISPASQPVPGAGGLYANTIAAGSPLRDLLENGASGQAVSVGADASGEPILSFEDRRGDFCRQWRVDTPARSIQGVACRRGGGWQMEALAYGAAAAAGAGYGQAAADVPAAVTAAVDGLIGAAGPLDADQEKRVISKGWNKVEAMRE
jgi:negative regulator of sigma E activity